MRRGAIGGSVLVAVLMSGCTTAVPAPDSAPLSVLADQPTGERVYGFLDSQRGMNTLGPLSVPSPQVAISFRCVGRGQALVDISGIGQFPYTCVDPPDPGIRNVFASTGSPSYTVKVMALNDVMWAITVSEPLR